MSASNCINENFEQEIIEDIDIEIDESISSIGSNESIDDNEDNKCVSSNEIYNFRDFNPSNDYYDKDFEDYFEKINVENMSIEEDNKRIFNKHIDTVLSESYLGGLFDGDGSISIVYSTSTHLSYTSSISLSQSRTNIIQLIRYHFGGKLHIENRTNRTIKNDLDDDGLFDKKNRRKNYGYKNTHPDKFYLANYLKNGIIIKEQEIDCLLELQSLVKRPGLFNEKNTIFDKMKYLKENRINLEVNLDKVNIYYIAGLFDAEGYCYMSKKNLTNKYTRSVYMKITQKNYPKILEKICEYLGFGKIVGEYIFYLSGAEECYRFIQLIENKLIVKFNEVQILKNYIETKEYTCKNGYDLKIHYYRHYLNYLMSKEKHENETIENSEINILDEYKTEKYIDFCIKQENQENEIKMLEEKIIKDKIKEENNKLRSQKMKGENNPNFGKKRTDERNKKSGESISKTARLKNPFLSDDNIMFVLRKMNNGSSMYRVFEDFKKEQKYLSREKIKEFKEGKYKPLFIMENDISKQELIDEYNQLINNLNK